MKLNFLTSDYVRFDIGYIENLKYLPNSEFLFSKDCPINTKEVIKLPIDSETFGYIVEEFDVKCKDVSINQLFKIANAANYLNIKNLLKEIVALIGNRIREKTIEDLYEIFNFPKNERMNKEQIDILYAKHRWAGKHLFSESVECQKDNQKTE